jgi:hypothetical protein
MQHLAACRQGRGKQRLRLLATLVLGGAAAVIFWAQAL